MNKNLRVLRALSVFVILLPLFLLGCTKTVNPKIEENKLTIYAYDSLTAEWGLLPQITDEFTKQNNNTELNIVSFPDTGAMLNQLILEKDHPQADIVLGLDNINYPKATDENLFQSYQPQRASELKTDLLFDHQYNLIPFDYGYVDFVYDAEKINFDQPISLMDLAENKYQDKIIIEQPGLSSPGTQLLLWTKAALSDNDFNIFWEKTKKNILTIAPDWNTAYYSMFMEGEAPIVLSYVTSPAYHIDQEQVTKYKAIPIKEGYFRQIEGAGIAQNAQHPQLAKKFIDYLLTNEVQNKIPTTQWMFPVLGEPTTWPAAYSQIITPTDDQILTVAPEILKNNYTTWLNDWNKLFNLN